MLNRKKYFFVPTLSTLCVAMICGFSLLLAGLYPQTVALQEYPVLAPCKAQMSSDSQFQPEPTESERFEATAPKLPSDAPEYMQIYPEMYGPGAQADGEGACEGILYLTFDDGPSSNTDAVLNILDRYGIKATFFVVPNDSQSCMERLRKIQERGHTIGVHSKSHDYPVIYRDVESFLHDFSAAYEIIHQATGEYPTLFRFPGGSINSYNSETRDEIIKEMERRGFLYFDWNISAQDAQNGITSQEVYQNVISTLGKQKSGVVLMHDSSTRATTVEALPRIIETLLAKGFQFDRLSNHVHPVQF